MKVSQVPRHSVDLQTIEIEDRPEMDFEYDIDQHSEELGQDRKHNDRGVLHEGLPFERNQQDQTMPYESRLYERQRIFSFDENDHQHIDAPENEEFDCPTNLIFKFGSLTLLIAIIVFLIVDFTRLGYVSAALDNLLRWIIIHPAAGVIVFAVVFSIATVLMVPGYILSLAAGFIFAHAFGIGVGVVLASLSVFLGIAAGAVAAFGIGKHAFKETIQNWSSKYKVLRAINKEMEAKGLQLFLLLRLSRLIPFNTLNYVSGTTKISLHIYILSLIGSLPETVGYAVIGAAASGLLKSGRSDELSDEEKITRSAFYIAGAIIMTLAIAALGTYAKRVLRNTLENVRSRSETLESHAAAELESANSESVDIPPLALSEEETKAGEPPRRNSLQLRVIVPSVNSPALGDEMNDKKSNLKLPDKSGTGLTGEGNVPLEEIKINSECIKD